MPGPDAKWTGTRVYFSKLSDCRSELASGGRSGLCYISSSRKVTLYSHWLKIAARRLPQNLILAWPKAIIERTRKAVVIRVLCTAVVDEAVVRIQPRQS